MKRLRNLQLPGLPCGASSARIEVGEAGTGRFRLKPGEKYVVDRLGEVWIDVDPEVMNNTAVWEHAHRIAQGTFLKKGLGIVRLGNEDCEVRLYPGQDRIVFAWGHRDAAGDVFVAANVYKFDVKIREQLEAKGLLPRVN